MSKLNNHCIEDQPTSKTVRKCRASLLMNTATQPPNTEAHTINNYHRNVGSDQDAYRLTVVTGKPGSGKTQHLKLSIKSMLRLDAKAIIVDAHVAFKPFGNYQSNYANLLAEFSGKLLEAPVTDQDLNLLDNTSILGIDVSGLSTNERLNGLLLMAAYIKHIASADHHIYWALEEAWSLGILEGERNYLQQLLDLSGAHCLMALCTDNFSEIVATGFDITKCHWSNLDDRPQTFSTINPRRKA